MLWVDAMAESTREWLDARQVRYLDGMREMKSDTRKSILRLEERMYSLEQEKL
jgi:hypothetical protein